MTKDDINEMYNIELPKIKKRRKKAEFAKIVYWATGETIFIGKYALCNHYLNENCLSKKLYKIVNYDF